MKAEKRVREQEEEKEEKARKKEAENADIRNLFYDKSIIDKGGE